ncbi:FRG domain-containing protein [Anaerotignum sp.]|uniref:FRG domain-containing protein n=1 Tax=Anaerotignum sp. TaxID=2039241 RepID=UPI003327FFBE
MNKHNNNIFCEYTIKSWEDCSRLFKYLTNWVFRGQANSSWPLQTTLERGVKINNSDIRNIPKIEKTIIEKFKRSISNYIEKLPDKDDTLEWISLMQHHGAPTRLLDFSYSYYVALYFSIEQALQESAVFCLNKDLLHNEGLKTEKWRGLEDDFSFGTRKHCNSVLNEQTLSPLVMLVEPYNLHERLSKQQGLFAIPFEGHQSFEYNLSLTVNKSQKN